MNINDYTGRAYNFRRYNCWQHVRAVRADAGLETPEFDVISPTQIQAAFDDGHAAPKGLEQIFEPQNFDAVLWRLRSPAVWYGTPASTMTVSSVIVSWRRVR